MRFTLKKGTHTYIGTTAVTFLEDTEVEVDADSPDQLAEKLAQAGYKAFGEHVGALAREETITRDINGVPHEVDVAVSYGAGGARVNTDLGEPRLVQKTFPARASGGIGTETVPGASGSGASFHGSGGTVSTGDDVSTKGTTSARMASAVADAETGTAPTTEIVTAAVDPIADRARNEFKERTEFAPAVGRFPSEVQTATDHPIVEGTTRLNTDFEEVNPHPSDLDVGTGDADKAKGKDSDSGDGDKDSDLLPENFPHAGLLADAGVTRYSELEGKTVEDLEGPDFPGIGAAKAEDILAALKKRKKSN